MSVTRIFNPGLYMRAIPEHNAAHAIANHTCPCGALTGTVPIETSPVIRGQVLPARMVWLCEFCADELFPEEN